MSQVMSNVNRKYNVRPDAVDMRDKMFRTAIFNTPDVLPSAVDLRDKCSPIVDQGQLGSCTANAMASGLREICCCAQVYRLPDSRACICTGMSA